MSRLNVNPTRIQLKTLKQRLSIAQKGHKMLKDKTDELIRRYSILVKKNFALREEIQNKFITLLNDFTFAKSFMFKNEILQTFLVLNNSFTIESSYNSILNIQVPSLNIQKKYDSQLTYGNVLPYSYIDTNPRFDNLVKKVNELFPELINLCQIEKTCQILASEIEKSKRRVNALEFVLIPQFVETIKYISMKIDENERVSKVRMLKVKSIIESKK